MISQSQAEKLVFDALEAFNRSEGKSVPVALDTPLLGSRGHLDSLGLVRFILSVEALVDDAFGVPVSLTDEKAMSQSRSPFRDLGALSAYITACVNEGAGG